ncbi:hypothetical protein GW755_00625 [bacterium]|nr:hypothetical protein [bacterium]
MSPPPGYFNEGRQRDAQLITEYKTARDRVSEHPVVSRLLDLFETRNFDFPNQQLRTEGQAVVVRGDFESFMLDGVDKSYLPEAVLIDTLYNESPAVGVIIEIKNKKDLKKAYAYVTLGKNGKAIAQPMQLIYGQ